MRGKVCPYLYKISLHPKISHIWLKLARLCVREQVLLARWATVAHGGPGSLPADPAFQGDPSEPGLRHVDNAKSSSLALSSSSLSSTFLAWSFVSFQKKIHLTMWDSASSLTFFNGSFWRRSDSSQAVFNLRQKEEEWVSFKLIVCRPPIGKNSFWQGSSSKLLPKFSSDASSRSIGKTRNGQFWPQLLSLL